MLTNCFGVIHFILAPDPIGSTFSPFCFPCVQDTLLGNVYSMFRLPRVSPSSSGPHHFHFSLMKVHLASARRPAPHFWKHIHLI